MTTLVTVELDSTKTAARARLEQAGFTVVRVTEKRAPATVTPHHPFTRASAFTDMPEDIRLPMGEEAKAYVRGYAKGAMAYAKKHGIVSDGTATAAALRLRTIEYEWDRHPACHRAAMKELREFRERMEAYHAYRALREAS